MNDKSRSTDALLDAVAQGCTCGNLRRASRAVTQLFDSILQPSGLKATQFTLLVATAKLGPAPLTRLAEALLMDRTTLTRNLKPLERAGLVRIDVGEDRRSRAISLTPKGRRTLDAALPLWESAQSRMVDGLGDTRWRRLTNDLSAVSSLTRP